MRVGRSTVSFGTRIGVGEKLGIREGHFRENRAGVARVGGLAFPFGDGKAALGQDKLNFPFHSYHRKDAEGDIYVIYAVAVSKRSFEALGDGGGYRIDAHTAMTEGSAPLDELTVEADGLGYLEHDARHIRLGIAAKVAFVEAEAVVFGVGGEDRNVLFASVKDKFFIEGAKAFYLFYTSAAEAAFEGRAEIISDVYLIEAFIEGDGLRRDADVYDLDFFTSYRTGAVDYVAGKIGDVDAQVLEAIFIAGGIENFIDADAAKTVFVAAGNAVLSFRHRKILLLRLVFWINIINNIVCEGGKRVNFR